ncbi:hypothetical protein CYY_001459 [Polysphondylium violaceum]|uniref:Major facilitator superfamily (MFS) profile domain-containing protein n=1 Tax=Polysphondylium violaceum TaxID=133409 RepID=A0A8J4V1L2_9MYCE|nr:hypothetical protein CYY_001459 [Polysphondylium violaceum]
MHEKTTTTTTTTTTTPSTTSIQDNNTPTTQYIESHIVLNDPVYSYEQHHKQQEEQEALLYQSLVDNASTKNENNDDTIKSFNHVHSSINDDDSSKEREQGEGEQEQQEQEDEYNEKEVMIVNRVPSSIELNNHDEYNDNNNNNKQDNVDDNDDDINHLNGSSSDLMAVDDIVPPPPYIYNTTPDNSDSDETCSEDSFHIRKASGSISKSTSKYYNYSNLATISNGIHESNGNDNDDEEFEDIALGIKKQANGTHNHIDDHHLQSPFKQFTSKLKHIIDSPASSAEKYYTFPSDKFNQSYINNSNNPSITPGSSYGDGSVSIHFSTNSFVQNSNSNNINSNNTINVTPTAITTANANINNDDSDNDNESLLQTSPIEIVTATTSDLTNQRSFSSSSLSLSSIIPQHSPLSANGILLPQERSQSLSSITRPVLSSDSTKVNYKILVLLSLSIFFSVSNLYYTQPILDDIGIQFQVSDSIMSLVSMSVQIGYAFGLLFISILGEIISKKTLTLALSLITSAALIGIGLSPNVVQMIIFHFIVGASTIIPSIAIPLALDLTTPSERASIFGILTSSLFIGLLGSRVISGVLCNFFGWRVVYFIASGTMFIISLLLYYFLPYTPRSQDPVPYLKLLGSIKDLLAQEKVLRRTCFIGSMVFGSFSILWTTLSYQLSGEPFGYSSALIGLFGLIGIAGLISSPITGKLSYRFSMNGLMIAYILICCLGFLILLLFDSHLSALIVGIFLLDLGVQSCHVSNQQINDSVLASMIGRSNIDQVKSRINAAYMASYFIGGALGSGTCGYIYLNWGGWRANCIVALLFLGLALACHLIYYRPIVQQPYHMDSTHELLPSLKNPVSPQQSHKSKNKNKAHYVHLNEDGEEEEI